MAIKTAKTKTCVCEKCGHEWAIRFGRIPETCANPKCRTPNWNKPREPKIEKPAERS